MKPMTAVMSGPAIPMTPRASSQALVIDPSKTGGTLLVLLATAGLALKGIWARLAYEEGMDVSAVLFYRSALSTPLVVLSTWWLLRRSGQDGTSKLSVRDFVPGALLGAMFSVGMMCDFEAIAGLGASVSRVVLFGFPLVVMLLEAIKHRKLPGPRKLLGFVIAWCGLFAVARTQGSAPTHFGSDGISPLAWGLASMSLYALYVWLSGGLSRKLGSVRLTSVSNLSTAAVVVGVILVAQRGHAPSVPTAGLGWIAMMVLISTVVPYFLMMEGIRRLGSEDASLLAMTGPVITVVSGWLLLGESLSPVQLMGAAGTLLGVGVAQGIRFSPRRLLRMTALNIPGRLDEASARGSGSAILQTIEIKES